MSNRNTTLHHPNLAEVAADIGENELTTSEVRAALSRLFTTVAQLRESSPHGTPGTGACICELSPDGHAWPNKNEFHLDCRCPRHGIAAQPAIWLRHPTNTLWVKKAVWEAIGVTYGA